MSKGTILKVSGPLVVAENMRDANMFDVVRVSEHRLIGEIIEMHGDKASIQVYEDTAGLGTGEPVESTNEPLSVELGPGLIKGIFDGIQRPLEKIMELTGNSLTRGIEVPSLSRDIKWHFFPTVSAGDEVRSGDEVGYVQETDIVRHKIMVAKWAEADIVVYIGCGERGNEMTDVLNEFPELIDPHTGKSLMERTVLIANTSDMPVAAREASIYTGITIAEYFRDMGYSVALMADSTSRWAEALREMSGRLEEMPGEEGYPAYLGSRLAQFYERAGRVEVLGSKEQEGALSVIGAVSPPGGDISEPVSQATLRIVKVFWGLDSALAYKRHFPAINWLTSYSLYADDLGAWFNKNVNPEWMKLRTRMMGILSDEASLDEIVKLVGMDALSPSDRLKMEAARSIREDFLHQLAFHEVDTYSSLKKQYYMMSLVLSYFDASNEALTKGADIERLVAIPVREAIGRFKYVKEENIDSEYKQILERLSKEIADVINAKEEF